MKLSPNDMNEKHAAIAFMAVALVVAIPAMRVLAILAAIAVTLVVLYRTTQNILTANTARDHARANATFSISELRNMSPDSFERQTAQMMVNARFSHVQVIGGRSDYGVDVLGIAPSGHLTAVQCKRYAAGRNVTSSDMQLFVGMGKVHYGAQALMYVTTGGYTADAVRFANYHHVVLVDAEGITDGVCDEIAAAGLHASNV